MREAWNHTYGTIWEEKGLVKTTNGWGVCDLLKMATGGWSGNEEIIIAMNENLALWGLLWESSHRGGLEVFNLSNAALQRRGEEAQEEDKP